MFNTEAVFQRLDLGDTGVRAVQRIREEIEGAEDRVARANELIYAITGLTHKFEDPVFARLVAMSIGDRAFKANHQIDDPAVFLDEIIASVDTIVGNPKHAWMFTKSDPLQTATGNIVQVVKDIELKVEVKSNGKIKKGGKQVLAAALYKKRVLEAKTPATNQQFIAILEKELDMSKAGATTYAYNCKKQLGEPAGGLVKAKKGRKAK